MRIGVDARMLKSSGIGKVIENILSRMIIAKPDWEFFLLGKKEEIIAMSFGTRENVHIIRCECPIYSLKEQIVLPFMIPKNLDCFWSPHYNVPICYRGKMIVTIHDLAHLALKDIKKSLMKRLYANVMFRLATYKSKKIICVSQFTKSELIKYVPNVDADKIVVIYNGVDDRWKNIKKEKSPHDNPYFVYVGNVKPHKNLRRLIEAYKKIANDTKCDLILVGKKDGFITADNNINDEIRGYENRIFFTGYVSDESVMQYVVNSEALVFPSIYEGFGLPPLEALAAGKKIIVSNAASISEVCGEYATYFDPLDENDIAFKLKSNDGTKMGAESVLKKFDWNKSSEKMAEIIQSIRGI